MISSTTKVDRLNDKKMKNGMFILLLILIIPIVAAAIRKLLPGQPNFVEPAAMILSIPILLWYTGKKFKRHTPKWLIEPMGVWIIFQMLYMLPSLYGDFRVSALGFCTRILPIGVMLIVYRVGRTSDAYVPMAKFLLWFSLCLIPVTILFLLGGNAILPKVFQSIQAYSDTGKAIRNGVEMYSAIFPTPSILSNSMIASTYLTLSRIPKCKDFREQQLYWFGAVASLFLAYVSGRRGAFYMCLLALPITFILKGVNKKWVIVVSVLAIIAFYFIDNNSIPIKNSKNAYSTRSELMADVDIKSRIVDIFIGLTMRWVKVYPFGTYLGFSGREGQMFGVQPKDSFAVDVGAGLLVVETGVFGALLLPFILSIIWFQMYRKSTSLKCASTIKILIAFHVSYFILFYTKELGCLSTFSIGQLMFWAVPGMCAGIITTELREKKKELFYQYRCKV